MGWKLAMFSNEVKALRFFQIEVKPCQFSSIPCKQKVTVIPLLSDAILKTQIREKDTETKTVLQCIYPIHRFVTFNEIERIARAKGFECCQSSRRWSSLDRKLNNIRFSFFYCPISNSYFLQCLCRVFVLFALWESEKNPFRFALGPNFHGFND